VHAVPVNTSLTPLGPPKFSKLKEMFPSNVFAAIGCVKTKASQRAGPNDKNMIMCGLCSLVCAVCNELFLLHIARIHKDLEAMFSKYHFLVINAI